MRRQHVRSSRLEDLSNEFGFLLDVIRLFCLTLSDAMQFVEIVQILQISTTRTSMAFIEIGDSRMLLRNRTQALPETP